MNTQQIEKNWTELKGKIKTKWGKFSDEEVESFKGDLNQLGGKIQKAYGIAKDHADKQFDEFKKSVQSLIGQEAAAGTPQESPAIAASPAVPQPHRVIAPVAIPVDPAAKQSQAV